ncbi:hypothetical protein GCM10010289_81790 [Streptomyces violascens]|uniref:Transposase n=1 Tax=Streptomyces violascens TaxID=67381 RepID=A0ABQ3QRH0_9ACTN|nr:hypothetical protein GCM10010289_81790 [Streptomyces violascens]GHI39868.1 hypothetical protein Sviol_42760 [Streptomyces violascens]
MNRPGFDGDHQDPEGCRSWLLPRNNPDELRERATRLAVEARKDPVGRAGAIKRIGDQLDVHPEAIETSYNRRRLRKHKTFGYPTPAETRQRHQHAPRGITDELSTDPQFVEKVYDVVGLYFNPPEGAVVLSVDEKSQIQALDRSQPVLPLMPGMPERRTHDYVRNGLTTLFAAFDVATGEVITSLHRRHRAAEFKKFLIKIDNEIPGHLQVHLICDNTAPTRPRPSRHG